MSYVDGFVLPVPEGNLDAYKKDAKKAGKVWLSSGALDVRRVGSRTTFRRANQRTSTAP